MSSTISSLAIASVLGCLSACSSPTATKGSCFESLISAKAPASPQVIWQNLGTPLFDGSGISDVVTVPFPSGNSDALFRVSSSSGPLCFQVHEAKDGSGSAWVSPPVSGSDYGNYCQSCPQRVSVGVQSALYLLPSGEPLPQSTSQLGIRLALRDCTTFLPTSSAAVSVLVEGKKESIPAPKNDLQPGQIPIQFIIGSGSIYHDQAAVFPDTLAAAVDVANTLFAGGNLRIVPVRIRRIAGEDPLTVQRGDHAALDRLGMQAFACDSGSVSRDDAIPVVLAGCLQVRDPLLLQNTEVDGYTPHIPDGFSSPSTMHGVFLKGRSCSASAPPVDLGPQVLGKLLAHELGHYLGLYHSAESDGTMDQIADTSSDNIMNFRPLQIGSPKFTSGQFQIMRRHPAMVWQ
ncbi:MAG TPA: hypothetical protein PKO07_11210 [Pseudomonadota bacterium]|nr:hypothetical protein [Pseudomonadota bacterium]